MGALLIIAVVLAGLGIGVFLFFWGIALMLKGLKGLMGE